MWLYFTGVGMWIRKKNLLNKEWCNYTKKPQTQIPVKFNQLEARIKYTDDKINKLVLELYGLSEEEIGIISFAKLYSFYL